LIHRQDVVVPGADPLGDIGCPEVKADVLGAGEAVDELARR